jgi:dienelactone hydrolase
MPGPNESFLSAAGPIPIEVHLPPSGGKHRAVLILHGTLALEGQFGADIRSFADALNKNDMAAAIPHYFKSTPGTKPSDFEPADKAVNLILTNLSAWKTACGDALAFMAADARFDATHMGLIGFSLGGHLALGLAMGPPAGTTPKGVVDFFGPTLVPELRGNWSALPPALIHHGIDDGVVVIQNSLNLVSKLRSARRTVAESEFPKLAPGPVGSDQFIKYPHEGHGFKGAALAGSRDATIQFLDAHLK